MDGEAGREGGFLMSTFGVILVVPQIQLIGSTDSVILW